MTKSVSFAFPSLSFSATILTGTSFPSTDTLSFHFRIPGSIGKFVRKLIHFKGENPPYAYRSSEGVWNVIVFCSLRGYSNQADQETITVYFVAHSQCVSGMNSSAFPPVHLHFQRIFGEIVTGQGTLSIFSRLVSGIIGILNSTSRFCEMLSSVFSGKIFVTFAQDIASKMILTSSARLTPWIDRMLLLKVTEYS